MNQEEMDDFAEHMKDLKLREHKAFTRNHFFYTFAMYMAGVVMGIHMDASPFLKTAFGVICLGLFVSYFWSVKALRGVRGQVEERFQGFMKQNTEDFMAQVKEIKERGDKNED